MVDKIAYMKEAEWIALLDEIRKKGGTTNKMTAEQAKQAVEALKIGGEDKLHELLMGKRLEIDYDDVTVLKESTFREAKIDKFNMPNLKEIRDYAFYDSNISRFIREIGPDIFADVEYIGEYAFAKSRFNPYATLGDAVLNLKNVRRIMSSAFKYTTNLETVKMPVVTVIAKNAFYGADSIKEIYAPKLKKIYEGTFTNTSLKKITVNKECSFDKCFVNTKLFSVDIKENTLLNREAFSGSILKYAKVKGDCRDQGIFERCNELKKYGYQKQHELKELRPNAIN